MTKDEAKQMPASQVRTRLDYADDMLLKECEVQAYQASGPGGQKRNRTYSAVRLLHIPSGIVANAVENRSQHENKAKALKRLREEIAVQVRLPLPKEISWPETINVAGNRLKVNPKNPFFCHVIALFLDALAEHEGRLKDAASSLGISSSSFTRTLSESPKAWAETNRIRKERNLSPLKA